MGINAELVNMAASLRQAGTLKGASVIELGAQDVCVIDDVIGRILSRFALPRATKPISGASDLYKLLGFSTYRAIDASGEQGSLLFDLNEDLQRRYNYSETFDLVTNLGTAEHCFDQRTVFSNIHNLCKVGGLMIHALPAQGNVNHAFYNYHPRFFADLATANGYEVIDLSFTVDYKPALTGYTRGDFQKWDSHDILFYACFKKVDDKEFRVPFDGMFAANNQLEGYMASSADPLKTEFSPYLKGGNWENTKGQSIDEPVHKNTFGGILKRLLGGQK